MKKIRNYSAITAHGDVPARKMVLDLMDRVLQEVDSYQRIRDVMHVEGNVLHVGVKSWNLESKRNIYLLGAGKACNAMAQAVCDRYGVRLYNVLTGFKFLGGVVEEHEEKGDGTFLFG